MSPPALHVSSSGLARSKRRIVLFAQVLFLNLSHGISWNVRGYEDALWLFVFCQITRDCRLNLLFVQLRARLRSDDGHDRLTKVRVRNADDGAFGDARNRFDRGFDLSGVDVIPAGNDEILGSSGDIDVTLLIDIAEVA